MEGTLFVNEFLSYLLNYFVFSAAIVIAFVIGFTLRKNKNAKMGTAVEAESAGEAAEKTSDNE
ncbi:MAG: hypothetical protein IKO10_02075 [Lachnospiraceae bacterium]|nr:hypothetical protein [Lachnospiraceae bacterium]